MKTTFSTESHTSPVPGIIPEPSLVHDNPAPSTARSSTPAARRTLLARLLAALRGDKYMIDAYPAAGPPTKRR